MSIPRTIARVGLGAGLVFAGVSHLTWARREFRAQVPSWLPVDEDVTVLASGVAEIALGAALASGVQKRNVGRLAAAFFVAVFPGNVSQWWDGRDGFGLDSDEKRFARLPMQVPLILTALWSTK